MIVLIDSDPMSVFTDDLRQVGPAKLYARVIPYVPEFPPAQVLCKTRLAPAIHLERRTMQPFAGKDGQGVKPAARKPAFNGKPVTDKDHSVIGQFTELMAHEEKEAGLMMCKSGGAYAVLIRSRRVGKRVIRWDVCVYPFQFPVHCLVVELALGPVCFPEQIAHNFDRKIAAVQSFDRSRLALPVRLPEYVEDRHTRLLLLVFRKTIMEERLAPRLLTVPADHNLGRAA